MKKILCIGHASYDYTLPLNEYPIENSKNRINEKYECGGGPASNAAFLLGKWGLDTTFMGTVGNDDNGKKIIKELKSIGVNTDYIEVIKGKETTKSFIIVNKKNASRTVISNRDKDMNLENSTIDFNPDIILVDGQELEASKKIFKENKTAIKVIDAGTYKPETVELSHMVDYCVCSKDFAEGVAKRKIDLNNEVSIHKIFLLLEEEFNTNVIITLEQKGCIYRNKKVVEIMPSIEVRAVDTTGAGDIFHGAFVYGLAMEWELSKIVRFANITAALSTTKMGSRNSVFELKEVEQEYEKNI
ncbi:MAG TPA: PfkB family carbohydrate kinase [Bacilli bacterium]|nr:PfkB family carbohydrate kinase [Bacilli bacterium]